MSNISTIMKNETILKLLKEYLEDKNKRGGDHNIGRIMYEFENCLLREEGRQELTGSRFDEEKIRGSKDLSNIDKYLKIIKNSSSIILKNIEKIESKNISNEAHHKKPIINCSKRIDKKTDELREILLKYVK